MSIFKIIYLSLICCLTIGCHTAPEAPAAAETAPPTLSEGVIQLTDAQYQNTTISTTQIQQKNIADDLLVNGKIDVPPQNLVSISVPMGGYIKSTELLPGQHINKGQVLAVVEDQQYVQLQQDYLMAQSKLHFATLEYRRQKDLNDKQAGSTKAVQQAENQVSEQNIILAGLKQKLRLININPDQISENNITQSITLTSPISGFVSKVNVNIGKYVAPSEILFELVNPSDIHLNLKVFEKDLGSIALGKKVLAYPNATPDKKYHCEIILISKDIAPDGTTEVHCHFKNYDKTLIPGMYMNALITTTNRNIDVLPESAVVSFEGKYYVFIETGKQQYRLQAVDIGKNADGWTEIKQVQALQGQKVVDKGAYSLLMKAKNTEDE